MLTGQSFWIDEGLTLQRTATQTLDGTVELLLEGRVYDRYQPLYFLLLTLWRSAFGVSEFAVRSLSVVLGSGAVLVASLTALRVYGPKRALWTAVLLSVSSFCVYYSQEARPYALLLVLVAAQLYFFSYAFTNEGGAPKAAIGAFWLSVALGTVASLFTCLFTASLCVAHLIVSSSREQWLKWWSVPAATLSALLIVYWMQVPSGWNPRLAMEGHLGFSLAYNMFFVVYGVLVGRSYGPSVADLHATENKLQVVADYSLHLALLAVVVGVIAGSIITRLMRSPDRQSTAHRFDVLLALLFSTSLVIAAIFALLTGLNWLPRHSFYLSIIALLLIPAAFAPESPRLREGGAWGSMLAKAAVVLFVGLNVSSLYNYYFDDDYARDDYRAAAEYVTTHHEASTRSVLLWGSVPLLQYYGDEATQDGTEIDQAHFAEQIQPFVSEADTALILINRPFYWDRSRQLSVADLMPAEYRLVDKVSFPFFEVYRFTHTQGAEHRLLEAGQHQQPSQDGRHVPVADKH